MPRPRGTTELTDTGHMPSERDSVVLLEGETTNTSVGLVQGEQVVADAQTAVGARRLSDHVFEGSSLVGARVRAVAK